MTDFFDLSLAQQRALKIYETFSDLWPGYEKRGFLRLVLYANLAWEFSMHPSTIRNKVKEGRELAQQGYKWPSENRPEEIYQLINQQYQLKASPQGQS